MWSCGQTLATFRFLLLKLAKKHAAATSPVAHHVPNVALKTQTYKRLRKNQLSRVPNSDITSRGWDD
jgi:hypothetical protein